METNDRFPERSYELQETVDNPPFTVSKLLDRTHNVFPPRYGHEVVFLSCLLTPKELLIVEATQSPALTYFQFLFLY